MTPNEISRNLRLVQGQCKGYVTPAFGINLSEMVKDAADAIDDQERFINHILSLNSCNDCVNANCTCKPAVGDSVRYNCFFHQKAEEGNEMGIVNIDFLKPEESLDEFTFEGYSKKYDVEITVSEDLRRDANIYRFYYRQSDRQWVYRLSYNELFEIGDSSLLERIICEKVLRAQQEII